MPSVNQTLDFGFEGLSVEEVLGLGLDASETISLFEGDFSQAKTPIGDGGLDAVTGYYQYHVGAGLDLVIDRAALEGCFCWIPGDLSIRDT